MRATPPPGRARSSVPSRFQRRYQRPQRVWRHRWRGIQAQLRIHLHRLDHNRGKREAPHKVWRLKDEPQFTETLGPIGGFWMKYTLKRTEHTLPTRMGTAVQSRVELDRFILTPVTEDLGEPLEQALEPGSQFLTLLEQHRPAETTVTVWVYPDCYGSFRKFKKLLFERGYLTAGRPLPAGHPIGGSPQGTRSAVE